MKQPSFFDILRTEARLNVLQIGLLRVPSNQRQSSRERDAQVLERARPFIDEQAIARALAVYGVPRAERAVRVLDAARGLVEAEVGGQTVRASSNPFQEEGLHYLPPASLLVEGRASIRPSEPAWIRPPPSVPEEEYLPPLDLAALARAHPETRGATLVQPHAFAVLQPGTGVAVPCLSPTFQAASNLVLPDTATAVGPEPATFPSGRRRSIAEALLELGYVDVETSELSDPCLEQTLLEQGRISEELAFRALALSHQLLFVDVGVDPPHRDAATLLDKEMRRTHRVFGHRVEDGKLFVLTDRPQREKAIRRAVNACGAPGEVKLLVTAPTALDRLLREGDTVQPTIREPCPESLQERERARSVPQTLLLAADTTVQPGEVTEYLGTDFDRDLHALLLGVMTHARGRVAVLRVPGMTVWPLDTAFAERRYPALAREDARALLCGSGWPDENAERLTAEWAVDGSGTTLRALTPHGQVRFESLVLGQEVLKDLVLNDSPGADEIHRAQRRSGDKRANRP